VGTRSRRIGSVRPWFGENSFLVLLVTLSPFMLRKGSKVSPPCVEYNIDLMILGVMDERQWPPPPSDSARVSIPPLKASPRQEDKSPRLG